MNTEETNSTKNHSSSDRHDRWMDREPWVVTDPIFHREWLCPEPLRYWVHQDKDGLWTVIDRWTDIGSGSHKSREAAIRAFYKAAGRKMPTGEKLPRCDGAQHSG